MSQRKNTAGSLSDIGCVRDHNEDSIIALPPLYAVADGMGGHAAGEVASQLAVDILSQKAETIYDADSLIEVIRIINRAILDAAQDGTGRPGMGTTLTVTVLDGTRLLIAQVGDSRAYLLHQGSLQQLTRDHSYVGELVAGGHISESEAAYHPKRSVITRALGSDPRTEADIYELEASLGDRLLICSDGLYGMVSAEDIATLLGSHSDPQAACEALVSAARDGGGLDNISVIVVDINNPESEFLALGDEDPTEVSQKRRGRTKRTGSRSRKIHAGIIAFLILLVLFISGAIGGMYWYASNSAFLRAEEGRVVVYRGLPGEVLPGLRLEWYEFTSDVNPDELFQSTAERLEDGVRVDSLEEAETLLASYKEQISERRTG